MMTPRRKTPKLSSSSAAADEEEMPHLEKRKKSEEKVSESLQFPRKRSSLLQSRKKEKNIRFKREITFSPALLFFQEMSN